jgi:hypothetical protein
MTREHNILNDIAELKKKILKLKKLLNNVYIYSQMYHKCLILSLFSITHICFFFKYQGFLCKNPPFPWKKPVLSGFFFVFLVKTQVLANPVYCNITLYFNCIFVILFKHYFYVNCFSCFINVKTNFSHAYS